MFVSHHRPQLMYNVQIEIGMGGCRFELLLTVQHPSLSLSLSLLLFLSLTVCVSLGGSSDYLAWHPLKSFRKSFCFSRMDPSHGPNIVSHIIPN